MPQIISTDTKPTGTESSNVHVVELKKVGGRRIAPLISEESPSSVKSLYASSSDHNLDATRMPSPPSPTTPVRPTCTRKSNAALATTTTTPTTTDRIQRIMGDPEEWSKFREQMKKGGHVTNAAAALDEIMKRAREEEEEAKKKKAELEAEQGSKNTACEDGGQGGANADREEASHHSNLVNKGLRWINQTLTATNISREAEAEASTCMNGQLSYHPSLDRSINRSHSMSNDRAIFLEGTLSGETIGIERQPGRRSRRGGRRRDPLNQELNGSASSGRQLPHRRNSADAVMSLEGYLTTNISAHACDDPMSLKTDKGQHLADTDALFDRQQVFDEDMDAGANISGHLNIPKDDDEGKSNLISETAKAVRRGSGSLVEYLSGITNIGQDSSDNSRPTRTSGCGDGLLEGWGGGRERRETPGTNNVRSDRIKQRGVRRVRSRSFDMLEAMQKGLGHEIDADDFMDGGGH